MRAYIIFKGTLQHLAIYALLYHFEIIRSEEHAPFTYAIIQGVDDNVLNEWFQLSVDPPPFPPGTLLYWNWITSESLSLPPISNRVDRQP